MVVERNGIADQGAYVFGFVDATKQELPMRLVIEPQAECRSVDLFCLSQSVKQIGILYLSVFSGVETNAEGASYAIGCSVAFRYTDKLERFQRGRPKHERVVGICTLPDTYSSSHSKVFDFSGLKTSPLQSFFLTSLNLISEDDRVGAPSVDFS